VAKTRAQRKAEQRRRQAQQRQGGGAAAAEESKAQHDTQVPESADVLEAELAEEGADLDTLRGKPGGPPARSQASAEPEADADAAVAEPEPEPVEVEGPADRITRRERRRAERERKAAAKESERRRAPREEPAERQRGAVTGFIASCWAELKRVQWPDRETLIQASTITVIFIAVMAAYLGVLDAIFNWLIQRIL
jgi:preprotein translocase SecE subunit